MKTYRKKTFVQRKEDVQRAWHLIDAKDYVLGDLAGKLSTILMGKDKPTYTPHNDGGDYIVLINANQIKVTGSKVQNKIYARHSNFPGGYKEENFADLLARYPEKIILNAVKGMLPANRLRDDRLARLKIFAGSEHTYQNYIK